MALIYYMYYNRNGRNSNDIKQIERDAEKIQCNPIVAFFQGCLKCIKVSISIFFRNK